MFEIPVAQIGSMPVVGLSRFASAQERGWRLHFPVWAMHSSKYDVSEDCMVAGRWVYWVNLRLTLAYEGWTLMYRAGWSRH